MPPPLNPDPVPSSSKLPIISSISEIPAAQVDPQTCSLLGPFALLIQALMAVIILVSLLVKRHREKPKRKYRIWTADVSKQVIGQAFVHMLNILISASMAALPSKGNPCALYFMNIFIDTTIGVFVLFITLHLLTTALSRLLGCSPASLGLASGTYPRPFLMSWAKQLGVYLVALGILKLFVVLLFLLGGPALVRFGDGLIAAVSKDPRVQVVVVVMLGPTLLNVLQFLLIDSFIKHKPLSPALGHIQEDGRRFLDPDLDSDSDDDAQTAVPEHAHAVQVSAAPAGRPITRTARPGHTSPSGSPPSTTPTTHSYPPCPSLTETRERPGHSTLRPRTHDDCSSWDEDVSGWAEWTDAHPATHPKPPCLVTSNLPPRRNSKSGFSSSSTTKGSPTQIKTGLAAVDREIGSKEHRRSGSSGGAVGAGGLIRGVGRLVN